MKKTLIGIFLFTCSIIGLLASADSSGHKLIEACSVEYLTTTTTGGQLESSYSFDDITIRTAPVCEQSGFLINGRGFINDLGVFSISRQDKNIILHTPNMNITCDIMKLTTLFPKPEETQSPKAEQTMIIIKALPSSSPYDLAHGLGYSWKTERKILAKEAGILQYRGTAAQNLKIQEHLLKKVGLLDANGNIAPTTTPTISVSPTIHATMIQQTPAPLVKHWGYYWPLHRKGLAQEFSIPLAQYQGSLKQNSTIKKGLLEHVY